MNERDDMSNRQLLIEFLELMCPQRATLAHILGCTPSTLSKKIRGVGRTNVSDAEIRTLVDRANVQALALIQLATQCINLLNDDERGQG